jgi:hypothetical protein
MFILPSRERLPWKKMIVFGFKLGEGFPKTFFDSGCRSCRIISDISIEDIIPWTKKLD